jgi:uncharacterized protein (TIGR00255 family)
MKSMTGYAYREAYEGAMFLSVEIKGYNSRFLEVSVNVPSLLSGLESKVRETLSRTAARGKIEVSIRLKDEAAVVVSVNKAAARAYAEAIAVLAETVPIDGKPSLSLLLGMEGVLETERARDDGRYWAKIEPLLGAAVSDFDAERRREGGQTESDILLHVDNLEASVSRVRAFAATADASIRENLRARFAEFFGGAYDAAMENRLLAETAMLLMKYTVSEELSRLTSHLAEFRAEASRNPSPGKKLDFLCQELNREINTIGSKTGMLEVSREIVTMKDELENIREQLHNIE